MGITWESLGTYNGLGQEMSLLLMIFLSFAILR